MCELFFAAVWGLAGEIYFAFLGEMAPRIFALLRSPDSSGNNAAWLLVGPIPSRSELKRSLSNSNHSWKVVATVTKPGPVGMDETLCMLGKLPTEARICPSTVLIALFCLLKPPDKSDKYAQR